MQLMTKTIQRTIPFLYGTENVPLEDKMLRAKLFCPWNNAKWFITEFDPKTKECFGFIMGSVNEWGYFSLTELEKIKGQWGMQIERDYHFEPRKFGSVSIDKMRMGL